MTTPDRPEWIDLTLAMRTGMPVYPGDPAVAFLPHSTLSENGYRVTELRLGTHAGTHLDAPAHFLQDGATVESWPLSALIGDARVIDLTDVPAGGRVGRDRLRPVKAGERLLLRTDWCRRWGKAGYYEQFPSLAADAIQELKQQGVGLLGLETPSICAAGEEDASAHRELLGAGVVILEGLMGLSRLPERVWLIALPLRLAGLDGAPCRVVAAGM